MSAANEVKDEIEDLVDYEEEEEAQPEAGDKADGKEVKKCVPGEATTPGGGRSRQRRAMFATGDTTPAFTAPASVTSS